MLLLVKMLILKLFIYI